MSSSNPLFSVIDSNLPDPPEILKEWTATNSASALNPDLNDSSQGTSTSSGDDIPGAFPVSALDGSESSSAPGHGVGETVMDTARSYLPQGVVNTLHNYLGTHDKSEVFASPNDTPHQPSYPTQEILGAKTGEHAGGVGSLSGTNFEAGVAKLPNEQSAEAGEPSHTNHTSFSGGPIELKGEDHHAFSLPSQEKEGVQPGEYINGVGSLPGKFDESRVALLPDERNEVNGENASSVEKAKEAVNQVKPVQNSSEKQTSSQTHGQQPDGSNITGVASVLGAGTSEATKDKSNGKKSQQQPTVVLEPRIYPLGGEGATFNGVDLSRSGVNSWEQTAEFSKDLPQKPENTSAESGVNQNGKIPGEDEGYHAAAMSHADQKHSQADTKVSDDRKSETSDPRAESSISGNSNGGSAKKVGFMEKVAGRSKILMGKLGNKPEKIEAGRKIISGEA